LSAVNKKAVRSLPFFLESDILSLSPSFVIVGSHLNDIVLNAKHRLHPPAEILVTTLARGTSYRTLCYISEELHTSSLQLHELLGFLNSIGALRRVRRKAMWGTAVQLQLQYMLLGVTYAPPCWRRKATVTHLLQASLHATTPVILAIGVVAALSWSAGVASTQQILMISGSGVGVFIASIVAHELGHVIILRHFGYIADILQMGMRLGVVHCRAPLQVEILSSLSGPFAGIALCMIAGFAGWLTHTPSISIITVVVGTLHLLSLLPFYGDGASVIRALRKRSSS
jgi:hypothetical protein